MPTPVPRPQRRSGRVPSSPNPRRVRSPRSRARGRRTWSTRVPPHAAAACAAARARSPHIRSTGSLTPLTLVGPSALEGEVAFAQLPAPARSPRSSQSAPAPASAPPGWSSARSARTRCAHRRCGSCAPPPRRCSPRREPESAGCPRRSCVRVSLELLLHAERRIECALRMVLVRDRRAEQREDAVAGGLCDVTAVAMDRVHHQLERGIDNRARLLGVEVLDQLHRTLDVGEQRGDGLALALDRLQRAILRRDTNAEDIRWRRSYSRRIDTTSRSCAALSAEVRCRRVFRLTFLRQRLASAFPHFAQKLLADGLFVPHFDQRIDLPQNR